MALIAAKELGREALAHADALYNHARRLTGNPTDADALVQETYTRALTRTHTFVGGNLKAWLFTILRKLFVDLQRREGSQPALDELDLTNGAVDASVIHDDRELEDLRCLLTAEIEISLGTLSHEARAIILLDIEGFTERDLAEVFGCPLETVKPRLSRARAQLRERLKDFASPTPRRRNTRPGEK
jgi:RNA polymerase sigma-70 factor (ECF subfamily)